MWIWVWSFQVHINEFFYLYFVFVVVQVEGLCWISICFHSMKHLWPQTSTIAFFIYLYSYNLFSVNFWVHCHFVYRCLRSNFPGWGWVWQGIQLDELEEVSFFVHCSCPEVELLDAVHVADIKKIG